MDRHYWHCWADESSPNYVLTADDDELGFADDASSGAQYVLDLRFFHAEPPRQLWAAGPHKASTDAGGCCGHHDRSWS